MRVLVTGAEGMLGRALLKQSGPDGLTLMGMGRAALDVVDPDAAARRVSESRCDLVVNLAAYTAVDRAESDADRAFAVNRDGAANLAAACADLGVPLIHLSTDYVFDGRSAAPYGEDDPPSPLSVYGASKAEGELCVRRAQPRHVILRVAWLYGVHGHSFVHSIVRAALAGRRLLVVDDQVGAPTHVDDAAAAILAVAGRIRAGDMGWGTFHFSARGAASRHQVACRILDLMAELGFERADIEAVGSGAYPLPAPRPLNSRLNCAKFDHVIGLPRPDWAGPLSATVRAVLTRMTEGE